MSSEDSKPKKPNKRTVPAQVSAQDTSNWDDKAFTAPDVKSGSIREFIGHELKREKSWTIRQPKDWDEKANKKKSSKD